MIKRRLDKTGVLIHCITAAVKASDVSLAISGSPSIAESPVVRVSVVVASSQNREKSDVSSWIQYAVSIARSDFLKRN
jgi:hypothetical protein